VDTSEKGIIFGGPMIRAILWRDKTQTRRLMRPQPVVTEEGRFVWKGVDWGAVGDALALAAPYGLPGETLYVKETVRVQNVGKRGQPPLFAVRRVATDSVTFLTPAQFGGNWKRYVEPGVHTIPARFIPRALARLRIEVEDIWVE